MSKLPEPKNVLVPKNPQKGIKADWAVARKLGLPRKSIEKTSGVISNSIKKVKTLQGSPVTLDSQKSMARVFQDLDEFGPYTSREIRPLLKEMSRLPKELIKGNKHMIKKSSLHIITKYSMEKDASITGKIVGGFGKVREKFISVGDNLANKYKARNFSKTPAAQNMPKAHRRPNKTVRTQGARITQNSDADDLSQVLDKKNLKTVDAKSVGFSTKPAKNQTGEVKLKREPTYDTPSTTTPKSDAPRTAGSASTKPKSDAPVDTTPRTQGPRAQAYRKPKVNTKARIEGPANTAPAEEVKKSRSRLLAAGAVTTGLAGAGGAGYMYGKNQANTDGLYYE